MKKRKPAPDKQTIAGVEILNDLSDVADMIRIFLNDRVKRDDSASIGMAPLCEAIRLYALGSLRVLPKRNAVALLLPGIMGRKFRASSVRWVNGSGFAECEFEGVALVPCDASEAIAGPVEAVQIGKPAL